MVLFFIAIGFLSAQQVAISQKKFFTDERVFELNLVADFKKLIQGKLKKDFETKYHPATITFLFSDSVKVTGDIEIRPRGKYRREECYLPPLQLNFKTSKSVALKKLGRLKLVLPCGSSGYDEQLILKEWLVYKIYNLLTEKSFRVRLVKMSYRDINDKIKPDNFYAFFIEDVDEMAKRNNCAEIQPLRPHIENTNRNLTTLVSIFQYMIGNSDWAVPIYHNVKLIRSKKDSLSRPFVVPYDLDYCGLVNARYAIPPESLPIKSVTERFYFGFPRTMEELQSVLQIFREQRKAMNALIQNCEPLSAQNKKEMIKYLDDFFEITEKERDIRDHFINKARRE
ncbi:MAG: hypothetical protein ACXWWC_03890 [Chitinophagaceae bacterium]